MEYHLSSPNDDASFEAYFDLRWRLLRKPHGMLRGSERDELEDRAIHAAARTPEGILAGVGRAHFIDAQTAQIRYMAVDEGCQGQGVGLGILKWLEREVFLKGGIRILLNARDSALPFYLKQGYVALGPVETPGLAVPHTRMEKSLIQ